MNFFRVITVLVGMLCLIGSLSVGERRVDSEVSELGLQGSGIGLGIMGGMCFMAVGITFLRKEEEN